MFSSPLNDVDEGLRGYLTWPRRIMGQIPISRSTLPIFRLAVKKLGAKPLLQSVTVRRHRIFREGDSALDVYVVNAQPEGRNRPAVLFLHGGGYIAGAAQTSLPAAQAMALRHDCVVVVPEYRLAPETPFPGALEDNYTTLTWMWHNAIGLGINPSRVVVYGESAGGGHAAALAIAARDRRSDFRIKAQILIYPMLDDRTGSSRPAPQHLGRYIWTPALNKLGWSSLLGVPAGSKIVPPGAVPARINSLEDLPPAFIGVGGLDLFLGENFDYAERLRQAGVPVDWILIPGAYHAFNIFVPEAACSQTFDDAWNRALGRAFAS